MNVYFSSIIIKEIKEDSIIYKVDSDSTQTKKVEILGVGPGYYNEKKGEYDGMPFKVGQKVVVLAHGWHHIDCESEEGVYRIDMNLVIKDVE